MQKQSDTCLGFDDQSYTNQLNFKETFNHLIREQAHTDINQNMQILENYKVSFDAQYDVDGDSFKNELTQEENQVKQMNKKKNKKKKNKKYIRSPQIDLNSLEANQKVNQLVQIKEQPVKYQSSTNLDVINLGNYFNKFFKVQNLKNFSVQIEQKNQQTSPIIQSSQISQEKPANISESPDGQIVSSKNIQRTQQISQLINTDEKNLQQVIVGQNKINFIEKQIQRLYISSQRLYKPQQTCEVRQQTLQYQNVNIKQVQIKKESTLQPNLNVSQMFGQFFKIQNLKGYQPKSQITIKQTSENQVMNGQNRICQVQIFTQQNMCQIKQKQSLNQSLRPQNQLSLKQTLRPLNNIGSMFSSFFKIQNLKGYKKQPNESSTKNLISIQTTNISQITSPHKTTQISQSKSVIHQSVIISQGLSYYQKKFAPSNNKNSIKKDNLNFPNKQIIQVKKLFSEPQIQNLSQVLTNKPILNDKKDQTNIKIYQQQVTSENNNKQNIIAQNKIAQKVFQILQKPTEVIEKQIEYQLNSQTPIIGASNQSSIVVASNIVLNTPNQQDFIKQTFKINIQQQLSYPLIIKRQKRLNLSPSNIEYLPDIHIDLQQIKINDKQHNRQKQKEEFENIISKQREWLKNLILSSNTNNNTKIDSNQLVSLSSYEQNKSNNFRTHIDQVDINMITAQKNKNQLTQTQSNFASEKTFIDQLNSNKSIIHNGQQNNFIQIIQPSAFKQKQIEDDRIKDNLKQKFTPKKWIKIHVNPTLNSSPTKAFTLQQALKQNMQLQSKQKIQPNCNQHTQKQFNFQCNNNLDIDSYYVNKNYVQLNQNAQNYIYGQNEIDCIRDYFIQMKQRQLQYSNHLKTQFDYNQRQQKILNTINYNIPHAQQNNQHNKGSNYISHNEVSNKNLNNELSNRNIHNELSQQPPLIEDSNIDQLSTIQGYHQQSLINNQNNLHVTIPSILNMKKSNLYGNKKQNKLIKLITFNQNQQQTLISIPSHQLSSKVKPLISNSKQKYNTTNQLLSKDTQRYKNQQIINHFNPLSNQRKQLKNKTKHVTINFQQKCNQLQNARKTTEYQTQRFTTNVQNKPIFDQFYHHPVKNLSNSSLELKNLVTFNYHSRQSHQVDIIKSVQKQSLQQEKRQKLVGLQMKSKKVINPKKLKLTITNNNPKPNNNQLHPSQTNILIQTFQKLLQSPTPSNIQKKKLTIRKLIPSDQNLTNRKLTINQQKSKTKRIIQKKFRPLEQSITNVNNKKQHIITNQIHSRVTTKSRSNSKDNGKVNSLNCSKNYIETHKSPIKTYRMVSLELYGSKQKGNMTDRVWQHQHQHNNQIQFKQPKQNQFLCAPSPSQSKHLKSRESQKIVGITRWNQNLTKYKQSRSRSKSNKQKLITFQQIR